MPRRAADDEIVHCATCGEIKVFQWTGKTRYGTASRKRVCRSCKRERARARPPRVPSTSTQNASRRAWDASNPEKRQAQKLVERAICTGGLQRLPCERCGSPRAHAHHENYARPLEVMWLCPLHHKQRHIELSREEGNPASENTQQGANQ